MMPPGNRRDLCEMLRIRQFFQHDYRLDNVVVDLVALFRVQSAPLNFEVIQFPQVVAILRYINLESPGIVLGDPLIFVTFYQVVTPVGENKLLGRQLNLWLSGLAIFLFQGDANAIIKSSDPRPCRDFFQALGLFRPHEVVTEVAFGDEGKIILDILQLTIQLCL